ncbi:MAG TPA: undecaprenyldiphospho-muramoylpentapeptide beta-N-acetylglucosaminyltransferase [Myxococcaceae bacterium]|nr:undecaprenyldiphospho-muramoylpentapeptide beta-N-acetylglucosaminyltransferase [Myxococcaceae bacterium]
MRVLIAGGGTGGHLFPGVALAEELTTRHPNNEVVFVGTKAGLEARVIPKAGYPLETITARGLKRVGWWAWLKGVAVLPRAFIQSWRLLRRYRPDVVVGVGGYASGPVVLCAWLQRLPTAIQEQNAYPGFTNRVLGKLVQVVFIAFEEARRHFPVDKVQLVGNPIRRKLLDNYLRSRVSQSRFTVLVFGGSLGARALNARVLDALAHLKDLKDGLHIIHQTGKSDVEKVSEGYRLHGFEAEVVEFIDDMSAAYAKSELVVCRSGAITLAEITVCKKAAILVPFPFAADNHQEVNARALVESGAALMFRESELTGERLAAAVRDLKQHPEKLRMMEKKSALLGRPEAAKELADVCVQLMVQAWGPQGRKRTGRKAVGA